MINLGFYFMGFALGLMIVTCIILVYITKEKRKIDNMYKEICTKINFREQQFIMSWLGKMKKKKRMRYRKYGLTNIK